MGIMPSGLGALSGFVGPMYSEKTTELFALIRRYEIARKRLQLFKPVIDTRDPEGVVSTHSGTERKAISIAHPQDILDYLKGTEYPTEFVAIDEIQFCDPDIVRVVRQMLRMGIDVAYSGLQLDFKEDPFGSVGTLMLYTHNLSILTAICTHPMDDTGQVICGQPATRTQRFDANGFPATRSGVVIVPGAGEMYSARCELHHSVRD